MVFNGKFKSCAEPVSPPVSEPQLYLQPSALDINRCVNDVSGELGGGGFVPLITISCFLPFRLVN